MFLFRKLMGVKKLDPDSFFSSATKKPLKKSDLGTSFGKHAKRDVSEFLKNMHGCDESVKKTGMQIKHCTQMHRVI